MKPVFLLICGLIANSGTTASAQGPDLDQSVDGISLSEPNTSFACGGDEGKDSFSHAKITNRSPKTIHIEKLSFLLASGLLIDTQSECLQQRLLEPGKSCSVLVHYRPSDVCRAKNMMMIEYRFQGSDLNQLIGKTYFPVRFQPGQ